VGEGLVVCVDALDDFLFFVVDGFASFDGAEITVAEVGDGGDERLGFSSFVRLEFYEFIFWVSSLSYDVDIEVTED